MHPSRPGVLFMQNHWDAMRSDNAGESWREVSGNLPTDFGFPIDRQVSGLTLATGSAAFGDLDGDVGRFDGDDREHSWLQAEFVGGLATQQ
jgi:hypothetical protein